MNMSVVPTARHTKDFRHQLDRIGGLVCGHELEDLDDVTSFCANQAFAIGLEPMAPFNGSPFEGMSRS